jgi:DNA invertase Pin-like site-specific DNA recombinase
MPAPAAKANAANLLTGRPRQIAPRHAHSHCRAADVLVVTKLDRLARSLPDARDIVAELTAREVTLSSPGRCTTPPTRSDGCCSTS